MPAASSISALRLVITADFAFWLGLSSFDIFISFIDITSDSISAVVIFAIIIVIVSSRSVHAKALLLPLGSSLLFTSRRRNRVLMVALPAIVAVSC